MLTPPCVLVFAGHDPTGGAGLCADIQTLSQIGCYTLPIVTSITVQNTTNVIENQPLSAQQVIAQARVVLADIPVTACKIGLLGSSEIVQAISQLLTEYPNLPVIVDPILAAGGGKNLTNVTMREAMINYLFPLTTIVTPNSVEARRLTQVEYSLLQAAQQLMHDGCKTVCITGTHEATEQVENQLYQSNQLVKTWQLPRLPQEYHGSGCTFAAAVAGFIAQGDEIDKAIEHAQSYTWHSLQTAFQLGKGQWLPNRLNFKDQLNHCELPNALIQQH